MSMRTFTLLSLAMCLVGVVVNAELLSDLSDSDPFEQCRSRCEMPSSSGVWAAGARSKHPVVQNRRQKQSNCADACICSTYCATLIDAGMPIDANECNMQCILQKPFSSQPQDWPVFFGEEQK